MSDVETAKEAPSKPATSTSTRLPYQAPQLTPLGSIAELTKGGDQEQRGEGPGFSL